uniref:Uncharacterized protein n=1 Tax=Setaria italica TaxID=4555 RepID=K4A3J4_SETIT
MRAQIARHLADWPRSLYLLTASPPSVHSNDDTPCNASRKLYCQVSQPSKL